MMARVPTKKFEFVKVVSPTLKSVTLDFTQPMSTCKRLMATKHAVEQFEGAIVKPSVIYDAQNEDAVRAMVGEFVKRLKTIAKHVYKPIYTAIKGEVRLKELEVDVAPLEAFDAWVMTKKNLDGDFIERAREVLASYFSSGVMRYFGKPNSFMVREIGAHDFMPFKGTNTAVGLGRGVYSISAEYDGLEQGSNRAGKTALLRAFLTALFGENRSDLGVGEKFEREIHDGADASQVMAMVETESGERIRIARGRDIKGKTSIEINGKRFKGGDAESYVYTRLNLTRDDLVKSAFIQPGDLHGIITARGKKLYDDMLRWLGIGYWNEVNAELMVKHKEFKHELQTRGLGLAECREVVDKKGDYQDILLVEKAKLDELEKAHLEYRQAREWRGGIESRIAIAKKWDTYAGFTTAALLDPVYKRYGSYAKAFDAYTEEYDAANEQTAKCQRQLDLAVREIQQYKAWLRDFDGGCPVDGESCPRKDEINSANDSLKDKIKKRKFEHDRLTERYTKLAIAENRAKEEREHMRRLKHKEKSAREFIDSHRKENVSDLEKALEDFEKRVKEFDKNELEECRRRYKKLLAKDAHVEHCEETLREGEKKYRVLSRKVALYQFLVMATGKNGIPSFQIENAVGTIEGFANLVLEKMDAPHRLKFVFQKKSSKKEVECSACGTPYEKGDRHCQACHKERGHAIIDDMSFRVMEGGREQAFEQDSAGGRALLALALRISLAKFLGISVLFLDEVCGSLDEVNLKALIRMLNWLPDAGFKQVFVISHRRAVVETLLNRIVIKRFDGWSKIQ